MTKKPRAFVLEPFKVDVSGAARYGDVQFIFPKDAARSSIWSTQFFCEIEAILDQLDYDPERDYVVATGHLAAVMMMTMHLLAHYGKIKCLFFHSTDRNYVLKEFSFNETAA